jgi:hypothetical protein
MTFSRKLKNGFWVVLVFLLGFYLYQYSMEYMENTFLAQCIEQKYPIEDITREEKREILKQIRRDCQIEVDANLGR